MARMIDADVVTKRLRGWLESPHGENVYNSGYDDAIWHVLDVIEHMPTLTQPGTVYCQDCIHHEDGYTHWCNKWEHVCPDDSEFFCKFGRKKDGSSD